VEDPIFTFVGYAGQTGEAYQDSATGYRLVMGEMVYHLESKDQLRQQVLWCIDPVIFPEHIR
jgi:hypothetical protein